MSRVEVRTEALRTVVGHALTAINEQEIHEREDTPHEMLNMALAQLGAALEVLTGEAGQPLRVYACDDCGARYANPGDLDQIRRFWERVEPGNIMPWGECPKCGALCYRVAD